MKREFVTKVLTANDLLAGDVVYRGPDGSWVREHAQAILFNDEQSADAALARAMEQAGQVVGPYLADATEGPDGPQPLHFREAFRTRGPSNYAHGKQVNHV